jgi:N-glycosylase/DNA lyase
LVKQAVSKTGPSVSQDKHITFDVPLALGITLNSGQAFRWQLIDHWYYGLIGDVLVRLRQDESGVKYASTETHGKDIAFLIWHYLGLCDDLDEVYQRINTDDRIAGAILHYRGLRLLRQDPWECLIAFICSATSNIPRISATMEALAKNYGHPLELDGYVRHTFPTPYELSSGTEADLRRLGLGFRAKYVAWAAHMVRIGELDLSSLYGVPYADALGALMECPGVGHKVADCVLLFSLNRSEAFPIDRHIWRNLQNWYLDGHKLSYTNVLEWAWERFGRWAGYANQYLFYQQRQEGKKNLEGGGG